MGQLGCPIVSVSLKGLPLSGGPPDCLDLIHHNNSRHWSTSFRLFADKGMVAHIWYMASKFIRHLRERAAK